MAEMLYPDFFMVKLVFRSDIRYNQTWRDGGNIQSIKYACYSVLSGKEMKYG